MPGVTILETSGMSGNVTRIGEFLVTQDVTAIIDGIPGTVSLTYTAEGDFSVSGWSGTYRYRALAPSLAVACDYTATFSGEKSRASALASGPISSTKAGASSGTLDPADPRSEMGFAAEVLGVR